MFPFESSFFIQLYACENHPGYCYSMSFFIAVQYSIVKPHLNFYKHSPVKRHLYWIKILVITNKAVVNILVYIFGRHMHWFLLGKYPSMELYVDIWL